MLAWLMATALDHRQSSHLHTVPTWKETELQSVNTVIQSLPEDLIRPLGQLRHLHHVIPFG
jgi:hypothetical protein